MAIRAVVFDRDGVLTYFDFSSLQRLLGTIPQLSVSSAKQAWLAWCERNELPHDCAEEVLYVRAFWEELADTHQLDLASRESLVGFDAGTLLRPFADARSAIVRARNRGLRIGVLSNFPQATIDASLRAVGLMDVIDVACSAPILGVRKPDPIAYLSVASRLGVAPSECVMVDDELPCVEGANSVGMRGLLLDRKRQGTHAVVDEILSGLSGLDAVLEREASTSIGVSL